MSPRLGTIVLSSQSDERLIRLVRAGHERAFAVIVERYRPELSAFARRLSPDGKAEDIVQQAFLSAFAALRSGADVKHLRGWLYRIVRNAAARSEAPQCIPLDGATASGELVEDVVQQRALAMSALAELARLPKRQRQAMVGTALDGRGRAEIATSMGVSEGAVRQLVHRARARIRTAVTGVLPWPLVRWLAAARPGTDRAGGVAAGVGAASSGGVAVKLGIVLASGAIATGVAVDLHRGALQPRMPGPPPAARGVHQQAARDADQLLTVDVVARSPVAVDSQPGSHSAAVVAVTPHRAPVRSRREGAATRLERKRHDGEPGSTPSSGGRSDGGSRSDGRSDGGSRSDGRSEPGRGGGAPPSSGDGAGPSPLDGGGDGSRRQGADGGGPSLPDPQAVIAADGGSMRGGDGGGYVRSGDYGSGSGSGSGAGDGSGSGNGGTGSGSGSAPGDGGSSAAVGGSGR